MNLKEDIQIFYPKSKEEWRNWLIENHTSQSSVWLVFYKKSSDKASISWSEAVDEALCFGWIDSLKKKLDDEKSIQFFSKRKAKSTWSKVNKLKVEQLHEKGLISEAGYESIAIAKQNGSWNILDEVEELIVPEDLKIEFEKNSLACENYNAFSKSSKKAILHWIVMAKKPETRSKRIEEIINKAIENKKPKHIP